MYVCDGGRGETSGQVRTHICSLNLSNFADP